MWQWRKKLELCSYNQEVPKISGMHQKLWQRQGTSVPWAPRKKQLCQLTSWLCTSGLQNCRINFCHVKPHRLMYSVTAAPGNWIQLSISVWFLVLWEESNLYLTLRSVNLPSLFKDLLISQLSFGRPSPTGKISSLSARRVPSHSKVVSPPCHSHISLCPQVPKMHFRPLALSLVLCLPLD